MSLYIGIGHKGKEPDAKGYRRVNLKLDTDAVFPRAEKDWGPVSELYLFTEPTGGELKRTIPFRSVYVCGGGGDLGDQIVISPPIFTQVLMSKKEAIEKLDHISSVDPESAHSEADAIILQMVDPEIAQAYERLVDRCSFWACA